MQDTIYRTNHYAAFQKADDSLNVPGNPVNDSLNAFDSTLSPFISGESTSLTRDKEIIISRDISFERIDDWYLMMVIGVLILLAWLRAAYPKYMDTIFTSSYNYNAASKAYSEKTIVQKRISFLFNLFYFINGSLFFLEVYRHYNWEFLDTNNFGIFLVSFACLVVLVLLRIIVMSLTGHIFNRYELFKSFLYHYYTFSKVIGIILTPFVITLPYTSGDAHNILFYCALILTGLILLLRFVRIVVFVRKNVLLIFYLFLYLCAVELLPILVIIKLILSFT